MGFSRLWGREMKCKQCGRKLSSYNKSGICWSHQVPEDRDGDPLAISAQSTGYTGPQEVFLHEELPQHHRKNAAKYFELTPNTDATALWEYIQQQKGRQDEP